MKEDLSKKNVNFEFINILESLSNLKEYLEFRDNMPEFEPYKKNNKLGIPLVLIDENNKDDLKILIEHSKADFI